MRGNVVYVDFSKKRKVDKGIRSSSSFSILSWIKNLFRFSNSSAKPKNSPFICKRIL